MLAAAAVGAPPSLSVCSLHTLLACLLASVVGALFYLARIRLASALPCPPCSYLSLMKEEGLEGAAALPASPLWASKITKAAGDRDNSTVLDQRFQQGELHFRAWLLLRGWTAHHCSLTRPALRWWWPPALGHTAALSTAAASIPPPLASRPVPDLSVCSSSPLPAADADLEGLQKQLAEKYQMPA